MPAADKPRKPRKLGQPPRRWFGFMADAAKRIAARGGYKTGGDPAAVQLAAEIVAAGAGAVFLKAARRGRPTQVQGMRYQLLRDVEKMMDDAGQCVRRRRADANTPDALALKNSVVMELASK